MMKHGKLAAGLLILFTAILFSGCSTAHKNSTASKRIYLAQLDVAQSNQSDNNQAGESAEVADDGYSDIFDDLEEDEEEPLVYLPDPLAPFNRAMFHFNDKLYFWALKPVAKGYKAVVPTTVRVGIDNFFHNATTPVRMVNCILQDKGAKANEEFARFMVNTTIGLLGFIDMASTFPEFENAGENDEDMGQTLAVWGVGDGIYLVLPFFGPSTLRDTVGMAIDWPLSPFTYVQPAEASLGVTAVETVNGTSFRLGDYELLKKAALDPYEAIKDAYLQNRQKKIKE